MCQLLHTQLVHLPPLLLLHHLQMRPGKRKCLLSRQLLTPMNIHADTSIHQEIIPIQPLLARQREPTYRKICQLKQGARRKRAAPARLLIVSMVKIRKKRGALPKLEHPLITCWWNSLGPFIPSPSPAHLLDFFFFFSFLFFCQTV